MTEIVGFHFSVYSQLEWRSLVNCTATILDRYYAVHLT